MTRSLSCPMSMWPIFLTLYLYDPISLSSSITQPFCIAWCLSLSFSVIRVDGGFYLWGAADSGGGGNLVLPKGWRVQGHRLPIPLRHLLPQPELTLFPSFSLILFLLFFFSLSECSPCLFVPLSLSHKDSNNSGR